MKRPIESEYNSYAAYTRALEIYCDDDDIQTYQRPWVGLTDEEITDIWAEAGPYYHEDDFARAIEAKLKERNHG